jgi:hydrogenase-4 component F
LVQVAQQLDPRLVSLAFVCALLGYGAKAGLAPQHAWLPDVHGEAAAPVSAMLSGVLLKIALFALLRWTTITNLALGSQTFTTSLFLACGSLSLVIATLAILKTNRFKRVLAYHSLEHMGIIAFGLGIGTPLAIFGVLLHAFNHALTKELMFLSFGAIRRRYDAASMMLGLKRSKMKNDDDIQGALRATPESGALLALGGLSLVGSPPFSIFLSELIILWAAILRATEHPTAAVIGAIVIFVVSIILVFGGLISHLARILLDVPPFTAHMVESSRVDKPWPLFVLLGLILLFGLTVPTIGPINIRNLLTQGSCIVLGGTAQCR